MTRLIIWGVPVTWGFAAAFAALLHRRTVMTGAILVVCGPTVVGLLLRFIRPADRLERLLTWD